MPQFALSIRLGLSMAAICCADIAFFSSDKTARSVTNSQIRSDESGFAFFRGPDQRLNAGPIPAYVGLV